MAHTVTGHFMVHLTKAHAVSDKFSKPQKNRKYQKNKLEGSSVTSWVMAHTVTGHFMVHLTKAHAVPDKFSKPQKNRKYQKKIRKS